MVALVGKKEKSENKWPANFGTISTIDDSGYPTKECWINGSECSHGTPDGMLNKAPLGFCRECPIADSCEGELRDSFDKEIQIRERLKKEIRKVAREDMRSVDIKPMSNQCLVAFYVINLQRI